MPFLGFNFTDKVSLGDLAPGLAIAITSVGAAYFEWRRYRGQPAATLSELDRKLNQNEKAKLTAAWFNTIATGLLAAGFFPSLAALVKVAEGHGEADWPLVFAGLTLIPAAVILHVLGRFLLERLRA